VCLVLDDREDTALRRCLAIYDLSIEVAHLDFGDCSFEGSGPGNKPIMVGIERKRLPDLITSMTSRRLSGHQLHGMRDSYDYVYLLVEGLWRPDRTGGIEVFEGQWRSMFSRGRGVNFRQLDSYLSSLEVMGRVIILRSAGTAESAALYASRYHWWQKPFDSHHSHDQLYTRNPAAAEQPGKVMFRSREPGVVEKVAAQLPGIDRRAWDVGKRFKSVAEMVSATEQDWRTVPGIGKTIAKEVVELLHNRKAEIR
jgi:ERCC4-type nuclease